jgi:hypothetical protein
MTELYEIIDPRPVAAAARYTFRLPSAAHLNAIGNGDLVKAVIRAVPPSRNFDAERLWIEVHSAGLEWLEGTLSNEPVDMPKLSFGANIRLLRTHVISVEFKDAEKEKTLPTPQREFWERCRVDQQVLDGDLPIQRIYREAPRRMRRGDKYPDSGWRIRGDMRGVSKEKLARRKIAYTALGAVLNIDDSWVHLIDEPTGAAYEKNFEQGTFVRL